MGKVGPIRNSCYLVAILITFLLLASTIPTSTQGANFATHGGLAQSTLDNDFFVAGAMLADIDKFLPSGVPQTDSLSFTLGLIERAEYGTNDLKYFVIGWYEHLDQDTGFSNSVQNIQVVHPEYTDSEIRLGFDYLSMTQHPTDVNVTFVMDNDEIIETIRSGFTNITGQQVKQAIWDYIFSESIQAPGLLLQMQVAQAFAALYPEKVSEMSDEYDSYFDRVTAHYHNPFFGQFSYDITRHELLVIGKGHRNIPEDERGFSALRIVDRASARI